MPLSIVDIDFTDVEHGEVLNALQRARASGYVITKGETCFALILDDARVMNAINHTSAVSGKFSTKALPHIKTGPFVGLAHVEAKIKDTSADRVFCDKVTPNGLLKGWGKSSAGGLCSVQVRIDDKPAGEAAIDQFRIDLLREGIGNGCHGFSIRLPDWALDGKIHRVVVELVNGHDPASAAVVSCEKVMKLPFHFNLPRPWVGDGSLHAGTWTSQKEAEYIDIRTKVLNGDMDDVIPRAATFIDNNPQAIFLDFGIKDRRLIDDIAFEPFSLKLRSRWGEHFGSKLCERGLECCKRLNLPYNGQATATQKLGTVDLLSVADPWAEGGVLDKCPLNIRHFASKSLTREYAYKFGVKVPETYAVFKNLNDFDAFSFPSRYVLKPDFASGVSLYLMDRDLNLFDGFTYTKEDIRAEVAKFMNGKAACEFVVEEFVRQESVENDLPIIPLDYKIHCFGGKGRIIQVDDKNAISRDALHRRQSWLARDWTQTRAPFRHVVEHPNDPIRPPVCLPEMLNVADAVSKHLHDYVRIDFYASPQGPVLGEITSFSHTGTGFTEYADLILGQAWEIFQSR